MKPNRSLRSAEHKPEDLDVEDLLHPAHAFDHPRDVVNDPDLSLNEKRAILAAWASDACAVEATPALRHAPGGRCAVSIDDILIALRSLDKVAHDILALHSETRRTSRRRSIEDYRRKRSNRGGGSPGQSLVH